MIYFFIYYQSKEKESQNDVEFLVPEDNNLAPKCIYVEESYENKTYSYKKIFKVNKSTGKGPKGNQYYFEFLIEDDKYIISFDSKGKTFIYDVSLEKGKKKTKN